MHPPTSRRALLAEAGGAFAVCLAGCTASTSAPENDEPQYRRVELTDADSVDDAQGFTTDVSVVEPEVTPEHSARLRIEVTNEGDERRVYQILPEQGVFDNYRDGLSDPPGVILQHITGDRWDDPDDGDGRWSMQNPNGGGGVGKASWWYPAGETVVQEYRVLDDADEEGYLEPGSYRFEVEFGYYLADGEDDPEREEFVWGFSLDVERVEA